MGDDICTIPGCGEPKLSRGWCNKHYGRWKRHGDATYEPPAAQMRSGQHPIRFAAVGQRFGRWVVVDPDVRVPSGRRGALVRCSCPRGTERVLTLADLFAGKSESCGCISGERLRKMNREANGAITHGLSGHPLFYTHANMLRRCENPADSAWPRYGARGIKVCERWHDLATFIADIESSIGPRPAGKHPSGHVLYSLDRIDNDGDYEPGNVQWSTTLAQNRNRRQWPWLPCAQGHSNPGWAKFCCTCGSAMPTDRTAA